MLPVALACQDTATLDKLLAETTQLFEDHERDAADTIMLAFDKGTYTKVGLLIFFLAFYLFFFYGCHSCWFNSTIEGCNAQSTLIEYFGVWKSAI